MSKVIIVGAGVSGIYASILIKKNNPNLDVIVLEANSRPLKKLLVTGNGRCNLSNEDMQVNYYDSDDKDYVQKIISSFNMKEEMAELGLLTTSIGSLLYPRSEQASSVKEVLLKQVEELGVLVICHQHVSKIDYERQYHIYTEDKVYHSDYCILSMGSIAGKQSGTDIDRYVMLKKLNLKVIEPTPSLCALYTKEHYPFKGVRVKGTVSLIEDHHLIKEESGEILFTDYGISGICIMQLSHFIHENHHYEIEVDLLPEVSAEEVLKLLKQCSIEGIVNLKIADYLNKHHVHHEQLVSFLKHLTFHVQGKRESEYAQVMQGGLSLKEVDEHLHVHHYPGLYVTGELLNVTGMCGGYNLHFAFASAKTVATHLLEEDHAKNQ